MNRPEVLLIEDILIELRDLNKSLESILSSLYNFSNLIQSPDLFDFTKKEIEGYNISDVEPDYRIINADLKIDVIDGTIKEYGLTLPKELLDFPFIGNLSIVYIKEGIRSIENNTNVAFFLENEYIRTNIDPIFLPHILPTFNKIYNKQVPLESINAYLKFSRYNLYKIVTTLRSRLLQFTMEMKNTFGPIIEINSFVKNQENNNNTIREIIEATIDSYGLGPIRI
ncbi:MAG: hypothetical protein ABIU11_03820 [Chitinophagaceae bacterium]